MKGRLIKGSTFLFLVSSTKTDLEGQDGYLHFSDICILVHCFRLNNFNTVHIYNLDLHVTSAVLIIDAFKTV